MEDIRIQKGEDPFGAPAARLKAGDPVEIAHRSGARWEEAEEGRGRWVLPVLTGEFRVSYPDIAVEATEGLGSFTLKLLSLLYLAGGAGTAPAGRWMAYRELPGGRFYEPVVRSSVEEPLAGSFGARKAAFTEACDALGGTPEEFGDASCSFTLFPNVRIAFILWAGDDEFPPKAQVLFDSAAGSHLGAFDLRMAAQDLAGRLIKAGEGESR